MPTEMPKKRKPVWFPEFTRYPDCGEDKFVTHIEWLHFHATIWETTVGHTPKKLPNFLVVDMAAANGPQCRTQRLWLYAKSGTILIDWR